MLLPNESGITLRVNATLTVDKHTAETCLKLVEQYINQEKCDAIGVRDERGYTTLKFEYKE